MENKIEISFNEWKKRSTEEYINAICKPCWELRYCPYGVLVENFEVRGEIDAPYRCRVFGHICPVFKIAEPLTETKEKRNISRNISSVTQRRVLDETIIFVKYATNLFLIMRLILTILYLGLKADHLMRVIFVYYVNHVISQGETILRLSI